MTLDVFYATDIQRVLTALASAGRDRGTEYREALADVALAFGLQPTSADARLEHWPVGVVEQPAMLVAGGDVSRLYI